MSCFGSKLFDTTGFLIWRFASRSGHLVLVVWEFEFRFWCGEVVSLILDTSLLRCSLTQSREAIEGLKASSSVRILTYVQVRVRDCICLFVCMVGIRMCAWLVLAENGVCLGFASSEFWSLVMCQSYLCALSILVVFIIRVFYLHLLADSARYGGALVGLLPFFCDHVLLCRMWWGNKKNALCEPVSLVTHCSICIILSRYFEACEHLVLWVGFVLSACMSSPIVMELAALALGGIGVLTFSFSFELRECSCVVMFCLVDS